MDESETVSVVRWEGGAVRAERDELAEEEPLEIRVRNRAVSVTMRTGGNDEELAAGFLLTEGIIHRREDVLRIEPCGRNEFGNVINVVVGPMVEVDFAKLTRHVFTSSSCGLCGKATIEAVRGAFEPVERDDSVRVGAAVIAGLPEAMRAGQAVFARTGGLHAAGLFDATGKMRVVREDIGRHNAVDKVVGHALLAGWGPLGKYILLVSGRASFEIMQKALAARIAIVAAVSAPSSLAARFAEENGQTLVGFLRGARMNVYAHGERIQM